MSGRLIGVAATFAAVLLLLGSLVLGLGSDHEATDLPAVIPAAGITLPAGERIRVEVLNGAGIAGLARRVTEELRAEGFDVVYYGNAGPLTRDSTTILDRSGDSAAVSALAAALGVDRVEEALDTTLYLEATVVLAPDWPAIERDGNP